MRWKTGALLALVASAAPAPAWTATRLTITPRDAMVDAPVVIRLEGVAPNREITLRASVADAGERTWRSEATFAADRKGVVDVALSPALRGSYAGVDAMGLFWSMKPDVAVTPPRAPFFDLLRPPEGPAFPRPVSGTLNVKVEAFDGATAVATHVALRRLSGPEVKVTEVREGELVGRLYEPPGTRQPALLVLGGSNGGVPAPYAPVLAGHGFVTFAQAYFRAEGLPQDLVEIPLESLQNGIEWLRARPSVDPERVAVIGLSRGAELALLLGAHFPEVKAVVALAPSHAVWEGAVRDPSRQGVDAIKLGRSSWTLEGRALPFVPKTVSPETAARIAARTPIVSLDLFRPGLAAAPEGAEIPVEKTGGPILLVSSRADQLWPAAEMGERVLRRLQSKGSPVPVQHLVYDEAAHVLPDAWLPPGYGGSLGGTAAGTMNAYREYWPRVVAFLRDALSRPSAPPSR